METNRLTAYFLRQHPKISARTLQQYTPEEAADFLEDTPPAIIASITQELIPSYAADCLKFLPADIAAKVLSIIGVEQASLLMRRMKSSQRVKLIRAMPTVFANMVRLVLRYPDSTVGYLMNPDVFTVNEEMTVSEVVRVLKQSNLELQDRVYVLDSQQRLTGIIPVSRLLISEDSDMKSIMSEPDETVSARTRIDNLKINSNQDAIPVVDHAGVFVGVINMKTVTAALESKREHQGIENLSETALSLAEILWDTCANMISPDYHTDSRKKKHDD